MGSELGAIGSGHGDGMTAGARLYQLFVQIGSTTNRIVNPNPDRLGAPLPPTVRAVASRAEPIVLVGGYASMVESLEPLAASLRADGFTVFVFDVPDNGLADLHYSARRLAAFVAPGSRLVNSLTDSQLGRWFTGGSTRQLLHDSPHVRELERTFGSLARAGARLTPIYVDGFDGLLALTNTGVVLGARNIRLDHPGLSVSDAGLGHFTLHRRNHQVYELVRGLLLEDR